MDKDILSDYHLERYVLGELPLELDRKIRWLAAVDPRIRGAVADIEASNRDILARYPPPAVKAGILARLQTKGRRSEARALRSPRTGWLVPVTTAAAALALLLAVLVPGWREKALGIFVGAGRDGSRVKGIETVDLSKTQLLVFRHGRVQAEMLEDRNRARAGDLLQLAYVAAGDPYGVIFSIDGRGGVTLHFPEEAGGSTALVQNRKFLLPNAIELDDAPGFERFFLVTSASPLDVTTVLEWAEALASNPGKADRAELNLPAGLDQSSILILKGEGT